MFKIKPLVTLFTLLCIGYTNAQSLTVVDCSTVLITPENSALTIDTTVDITVDSLWNSQSNFEIMFIVKSSDASMVNKVHINIGNMVNDSTLLSTSFDASSNISGSSQLIYEAYNDYVNVRVGEFTIDHILHYSIKLEDDNGLLSTPYQGTIEL